jgi:hypothetical protein
MRPSWWRMSLCVHALFSGAAALVSLQDSFLAENAAYLEAEADASDTREAFIAFAEAILDVRRALRCCVCPGQYINSPTTAEYCNSDVLL